MGCYIQVPTGRMGLASRVLQSETMMGWKEHPMSLDSHAQRCGKVPGPYSSCNRPGPWYISLRGNRSTRPTDACQPPTCRNTGRQWQLRRNMPCHARLNEKEGRGCKQTRQRSTGKKERGRYLLSATVTDRRRSLLEQLAHY